MASRKEIIAAKKPGTLIIIIEIKRKYFMHLFLFYFILIHIGKMIIMNTQHVPPINEKAAMTFGKIIAIPPVNPYTNNVANTISLVLSFLLFMNVDVNYFLQTVPLIRIPVKRRSNVPQLPANIR